MRRTTGVIELVMTGAADYSTALDRAMTAMYSGKDVQGTLDDLAKEWDAITKRTAWTRPARRTSTS